MSAPTVPCSATCRVPARRGRQRGRLPRSPPFTLAGEVFEKSGHGDLIRIFLPFGSDHDAAAPPACSRSATTARTTAGRTGARSRRCARPPAQVAVGGRDRAPVRGGAPPRRAARAERRRQPRHRVVDRPRPDASRWSRTTWSGWSTRRSARSRSTRRTARAGSAPPRPTSEELWRRQRGERSEPSFLFDVLDHGEPHRDRGRRAPTPQVPHAYVKAFGVRSLLALPLVADGQPIGAAVLAERDHLRTLHPRGGGARAGPRAAGRSRDQERTPACARRRGAAPAEGLRARRLRAVGPEGLRSTCRR